MVKSTYGTVEPVHDLNYLVGGRGDAHCQSHRHRSMRAF
jgi:hypothetical protein